MRKKIGKLMMIIGIGIILIPIIGSVYTYYEGKKLYEAYLQDLQQNNTPPGIIENIHVQQEVTQSEEENSEDVKEQTYDKEEGEIIGRIKIPEIKVDLLLIEGVSKKALELGAGHMKGTAFPGSIGNCAIAGHRNYTFGQIFNRLNEVELEDEIILEVEEKSYLYKVKDIILVKPQEVSILEQSQDRKEVTLITCHPIYRATHRLIVKGQLIE